MHFGHIRNILSLTKSTYVLSEATVKAALPVTYELHVVRMKNSFILFFRYLMNDIMAQSMFILLYKYIVGIG